MASRPAVTLFIPTCNAGPEFPAILGRIRAQRLDRPFEILVIDSGSADGTVEFLRTMPVRLIEIPHADFDHGLTRAHAIREAQGDIVVLTVQDASPADEHWMQRLVDRFADPRVAGAYSRQMPRPDANPFARARLERGSTTSLAPRVQTVLNPADFDRLSPLEKLSQIVFDDVSSSVRRSVALDIPFTASRFGEDLDWAYRVLRAGYTIVYEPGSAVIHSHNRSMWYEFTRVKADHQNLYRLLGLRSVPRLRDVVWRTGGGTIQLWRAVNADATLGLGGRLRWWLLAPPYSFLQTLAQYLGARSGSP